MIYIYYTYLSEGHHGRLLEQVDRFSAELQHKARTYRRWQDVQSSLIGRILLYEGIKQRYSLEYSCRDIAYTPNKKPYFTDRDIPFTISHSGNLVVCAFGGANELGIDVELLHDIDMECFIGNMTVGELDVIMQAEDRRVAFFSYWTAKEAVLKAEGKGLLADLRSFEVKSGLAEIGSDQYHVVKLPIDKEYSCTIAQKNMSDSFVVSPFAWENFIK